MRRVPAVATRTRRSGAEKPPGGFRNRHAGFYVRVAKLRILPRARIVCTVDAAGAARRREQAQRDEARVSFYRNHGGAGALFAQGLPPGEALRGEASIAKRAKEYRAAGIYPGHTMDMLRVLALVDTINGRSLDERTAIYRAEHPGDVMDDASGPDTGGTDPRDNLRVAAQTTLTDAIPAGATQLSFLGAASGSDGSVPLAVTYADGSTQTATLGFSDWTLAAGKESPRFGNVIAVTTPYRNTPSGPQTVKAFLFATAPIQLSPGKAITSVSFPGPASGGQVHVFAIGSDQGPAS